MSKIGYIRVSTEHQETARQQEIMCDYQVDRIFSEKVSGANKDRPQLKAMLDYMVQDKQYKHSHTDYLMCRFTDNGVAHQYRQCRCHHKVSGCFHLSFRIHIKSPDHQAMSEQSVWYHHSVPVLCFRAYQ